MVGGEGCRQGARPTPPPKPPRCLVVAGKSVSSEGLLEVPRAHLHLEGPHLDPARPHLTQTDLSPDLDDPPLPPLFQGALAGHQLQLHPRDVATEVQAALAWAKREIAGLKRRDKELYRQFLEVGSKINHLKQYSSYHYDVCPHTEPRKKFNALRSLPDQHLLDSSVISLPDFLTRHAGLEISTSIHSPSMLSPRNWGTTDEEEEYEDDFDEDDHDSVSVEEHFSDDEYSPVRSDEQSLGSVINAGSNIITDQSNRTGAPNVWKYQKTNPNSHLGLICTYSETSL